MDYFAKLSILMLCSLTAISAVILLRSCWRRQRFVAAFLILHYLYFVILRFVAWAAGFDFHPPLSLAGYSYELWLTFMLLLLTLWYAGLVGAVLAFSPGSSATLPSFADKRYIHSKALKIYGWAAFFLLILFWTLVVTKVISLGGIAASFYSFKIEKNFGYLGLIKIVTLPVALTAYLTTQKGTPFVTLRRVFFVASGAFIPILMGSRIEAALIFIVIAIVTMTGRNQSYKTAMVVVLVGAVALFGFRMARDNLLSISSVGQSGLSSSQQLGSLHLNHLDATLFSFVARGEISRSIPDDYWVVAASSMLPIAKTSNTTVELGPYIRRAYEANIVNGWPGFAISDYYIYGGWLGIGLGFLLSAVFFSFLARMMTSMRTSGAAAGLSFLFVFYICNGGLLAHSGRLIIIMLPFLVIMLLVGRRVRLSGH